MVLPMQTIYVATSDHLYDNINDPLYAENGQKTTYAKNAWSQSNFLTSPL